MSVILDPRGRTQDAECVGGPFDGETFPVTASVRRVGRGAGFCGAYVLADGPPDRTGHVTPWVYRWTPMED